ncbi:hypothetical protein D7X87_14150 [bacterium D16-54]|nr:hypothetical protein D7X87_14150 [bacterium D16-54]RKJ14912.1 hypothetical protein D7X65_09585 [bacterium D16-56]
MPLQFRVEEKEAFRILGLFRPDIDTQQLLEEINSYLLSCCWKMFLTGGGAGPGFSGKGLPEKSWTVEKGTPERKESLRWQFQI